MKHLQKQEAEEEEAGTQTSEKWTKDTEVKDIPSGKVDKKHMDGGFKSNIFEWERMLMCAA